MDEVLAFLVERWKTLGRPRYVQFDNARELAGGGKAARYLSRVIRLRLYLGVEPVFIPPAQPRYNDRPHQGQNSMACRPTNMRPATRLVQVVRVQDISARKRVSAPLFLRGIRLSPTGC
jgi:hypothetical protein